MPCSRCGSDDRPIADCISLSHIKLKYSAILADMERPEAGPEAGQDIMNLEHARKEATTAMLETLDW